MPRHSATPRRLDSRLICVGPAPHRKVLLATALDFGDPFNQIEYRETEGEAYYKRGAPNAGKASLQRMEIACTFHSGRANGLNSMRNQQEFVIGGYTQPKGHCKTLHLAQSAVCGLLRRGKADLRGQGGTGYDNSM
jgi:hypothetical protein